jgi:hypothetical protein
MAVFLMGGVVHETVDVTNPVIPFIDMLKSVQKVNAVPIVLVDAN